MSQIKYSLNINDIHERYRNGSLTPTALCLEIKARIESDHDYNAWIYVLSDDELNRYIDALTDKHIDELPLYGIPFAIKDNIDLAGIPTTAACPDYTYVPEASAYAVQCLIDAGAIPIGKTNLDQFATGLVGTRSPYGAVKNAFNKEYISGGSSSGSAVSVALGHAAFALGTDTAGSGRIPAAFNNLVGLKPTRGRISTAGVVPACKSLDCVSIFGHDSYDVSKVYDVLDNKNDADDFTRVHRTPDKIIHPVSTIGIPDSSYLNFFGNQAYENCFNKLIARIENGGVTVKRIDFSPFVAAAEMLYQGPWVVERYIAIQQLL
ncbi:MAG: amidase family protein, partial [Pseudomonadota bacterium]